MSPREVNRSGLELGRELVEAVLRAGLVIGDTLATLVEELPEDAFPGEDAAGRPRRDDGWELR